MPSPAPVATSPYQELYHRQQLGSDLDRKQELESDLSGKTHAQESSRLSNPPDNLRNKTGLVFLAATVSRIMRGHVMAAPFPLSDRATDVRPGCKTHRIAPTLRQVAYLVCARTKEREYFKTCIVGHVNCCLQCGPTLTATSVLQVSHDKSGRLQCRPTLTSMANLQNFDFHCDPDISGFVP
ncbi:hypothetical protein PoB_006158400 [Plakobranchus ocellatus]|uniref:Uncharacterized protein n=1 Tax=Plakobranchus ocellatus TaxID=259542 RepID=A0AAV4CT82_9GAST|nr:hypothetical protein PoB_006158400 [Plakobranchus ocellatus]